MPVHDWTRVDDGVFHSFHNAWIAELCKVLNSGLLPSDHYALGEQIAGSLGPDVLTLQAPREEGKESEDVVQGVAVVAVAPPRVRLTARAEREQYTRRQRTLVIRHVSGHRLVALLKILSSGNKASAHALRTFLDKALAALARGIHLLLIDLHPPTPRDPQGIHDKPLTLAAYDAGPVKTAYVEPVAVGDLLPEMPLFLAPEQYINVPLETTYGAAYAGVPRFYRNLLEGR
jgi:hypothetical protein